MKVLSQKLCCCVSLHIFKWVYGNPGDFLVAILCIAVYHVDYTTGGDPAEQTHEVNLWSFFLSEISVEAAVISTLHVLLSTSRCHHFLCFPQNNDAASVCSEH